MGKHNNRYDKEFKASAVAMVVDKGRSISEVAESLGVSQPALRNWVKASTEPEDSTSKKLADLELENKQLKKDLANANDTVEVLKKSVAIFIKP